MRCLPQAVGPAEVDWLPAPGDGDARVAAGAGEGGHGAVGTGQDTVVAVGAAHGARVAVGTTGRLTLRWHVLPERRIALMRMPRLAVTFDFDGCSVAERHAFLHRFDRVMQRGGG